jgi:hypothetical protein
MRVLVAKEIVAANPPLEAILAIIVTVTDFPSALRSVPTFVNVGTQVTLLPVVGL